jgi:fibronectin-binding autotransporter adhesin
MKGFYGIAPRFQRAPIAVTAVMALALAAGFWARPLHAQTTCTFTPANGSWDTAGNWSCSTVPTDSNSTAVVINSGSTVTTNTAAGDSAAGLTNAGTIDDSFLLTLQGATATNTGTINVGTVTVPATLDLNENLTNTGGTINVATGSTVTQNGVQITGGTISTSGTGELSAVDSGSNYLSGVTLNGTLDLGSSGRERVINGLTLSSGTVTVGSGAYFGLDTYNTGGAGNNGSESITGTGTIALSGGTLDIEGTGAVTLGSSIVVQGSGTIGSAIYNGGSSSNLLTVNGTINANQSGNTLTLAAVAGSGSYQMNGLLEATSGGILDLDANITFGAGATLTASGGGVINQNGVAINGAVNVATGTLNASDSESNYLSDVNYTGNLDLGASGRERIINGITLNGSTFTVGSGAFLSIDTYNTGGTGADGAETVAGTGTITLNGGDLTFEGTGTVTLASGVLVQGSGTIGNAIYNGGSSSTLAINNGTINANQSGETLILDQPGGSGSWQNNNVLEATSGGTLQLNSNITDAGGAQISAATGSTLAQNGIQITGGTISTSGTGELSPIDSGNNYLSGVTFNGTLDLGASGRERIINGITFGSATVTVGSGADFSIDTYNTGGAGNNGNESIAGTATITVSGGTLDVEGTGTATLGSGIVIQGYGSIGNAVYNGGSATTLLVNRGTIDANVSGEAFTLNPAASEGIWENYGTLEATSGGILDLDTNITMEPGTVLTASGGGVINQNGVTINGVVNVATGTLNPNDSGSNYLNDVNYTGNLDLGASGRERIINGITLNGSTFTVGSGAYLNIDTYNTGGAGNNGAETVAGTGTITLNGGDLTFEGTGTVTLASGVLVQGSGTIGNAIYNGGSSSTLAINNGTINANQSGETLVLEAAANEGSWQNNNVLEATSGGTLELNSNITNGAGGQIIAADSSTLTQNGIQITGGTISTSGTGELSPIDSNSNVLSGVTLDGTLALGSSGREHIINGLTVNSATITVGSGAYFSIDTYNTGGAGNNGNESITGTGTITLSGGTMDVEGIGTATLGSGIVVQGSGTVGNAISNGGAGLLVNNGTIIANQSASTLTLEPTANSGTLTNNGTVSAVGGGILDVLAPLTNYSSGTDTLTGGTLLVDGTATTSAAPSTMELSIGTNSGGEIVNNAANIVLNGANADVAFVDANGHQLLSALSSNGAGGSLTLLGGYTLATPGALSNAGTVTVGASSTLQLGAGTSSYTQSAGLTQGNGTIAGNVAINGGAINAATAPSGAINPASLTANPSTLTSALTAPGTLAISGTYAQAAGGTLNENIASGSSFGVINVSGTANINAAGQLNIVASAGVQNGTSVIEVGQTLTILTSSALTGGFTNASLTGNTTFDDGLEKWTVSSPNGKNEVLLASAVGPVTATWNDAVGDNSWTTNSAGSTNWSCSVAILGGCVPNNGAEASYDAVVNIPATVNLASGNDVTVSTLTINATGGVAQVTVAGGASLTSGTTTLGDSVDDVIASAGGTVNLGTLTNLSGGTLSGGGYQAGANGTAGSINIGGNVTTIAANTTVQLDEAGSEIKNGVADALAGLTNVNAGGFLNVYDGASESVTPSGGTLTNAGTVTAAFGNGTVGSALTVNGNVANTGGTVALSGNGSGSGQLTVTGGLANSSGGALNVNDGQLSVVGALSNDGTSSVNVTSGGGVSALSVSNVGTVSIDSTSHITAGASGYTQTGGTTTVAGGLTSTGGIAINGGTLQGTGTVTGALTVGSAGTLLPGTGPSTSGTLTVTGVLNLNGTLNEIINSGTSGTGYGVIHDSGALSLGGGSTLNLAQLGSYDPTAGTTLTIATAGSAVSGAFGTIDNDIFNSGDEYWKVEYNQGGDNIELVAENEVVAPTTETATWSVGSGQWTNSAEWSCSPSLNPCEPNNSSSYLYQTVLNSAGNTLTLASGNAITVDTLSLEAGTLVIQSGASLNLADQPDGLTDIASGTGLTLGGTFTAGGVSALAQLGSVEGTLTLANGSTTTTTPGSGTLTVASTGTVNVEQGSTLAVTGALSNAGTLATGNDGGDPGSNSVTVSGALTNTGSVALDAAHDSLSAASLTNSGTVALNGASQSVSVSGNVSNESGGTVAFNSGSDDSTITVGGTLSNAGPISLAGSGDTLTVTGALTNSSTMTIGADETVAANGGLTNNSGATVQLTGGTLNSSSSISNAGLIEGDGAVGAGVTNTGTLNANAGTLTVNGNVTNASAGTVGVASGDALVVNGTTSNSGTVTVRGAATWNGAFTNSGVYASELATNTFGAGLTVTSSGYLTGAAGAVFDILGAFNNGSTQNTSWNTGSATLEFAGASNTFATGAANEGATASGYNHNFAWGNLDVGSGITLDVTSGSLYINELTDSEVDAATKTVGNITDASNIYYNPSDNPGLDDETYSLDGGGELIPIGVAPPAVPEPGTLPLFALGAGAMLALGVRRRLRRAAA